MDMWACLLQVVLDYQMQFSTRQSFRSLKCGQNEQVGL